MNVYSPSTLDLAMESGSGPISEIEARKFAAWLLDKLPATDAPDQHVVLSLVHDLRELPKPEAAFGDLYRPLGYQPGWVPDP